MSFFVVSFFSFALVYEFVDGGNGVGVGGDSSGNGYDDVVDQSARQKKTEKESEKFAWISSTSDNSGVIIAK